MNLRPTEDRVVVRPMDKEETSAGGIVLPDSAKQQEARGQVVAVGPGKRLDSGEARAVSLKVGDDVVYGKYAGTEVEFEGESLKILREDDVVAVIEA